MKSKHFKKGYAVLELVFYIAFFILLSLVVISAMVHMTQAVREMEVETGLGRSGNMLERISREIRQAENISAISSTSLKLSGHDEDGNARTVEFQLSGSTVRVLENDIFQGNLNTPDIVVGSLQFEEITTLKSKAVKIILMTSSAQDKYLRSVKWQDTIVLRGSY